MLTKHRLPKVILVLQVLAALSCLCGRCFADEKLTECPQGTLPAAYKGCTLTGNRAAEFVKAFSGTAGSESEWNMAALRPVPSDGTRILGASVKRLRVICLRDSGSDSDNVCKSMIKEEVRDTTFVSQVKAVVGEIAGAGSPKAPLAPNETPVVTVIEVVFQCLILPRATVTITPSTSANLTSGNDCPAATIWDVLLDRRSTSSSKDSSVTILTGPVEHAFISANVPVKHFSELKYDSTAKTIVEKEQPSSLLVGLNYALGDVLTAHPWSKFYRNLYFSAMLDASGKPLQQFGVGVGCRLMKFSDSFDLSSLTVFIGRVWTKGDQLTHTDGTKIGARYPGQLQYGIGFNANKIVDFLKKGS